MSFIDDLKSGDGIIRSYLPGTDPRIAGLEQMVASYQARVAKLEDALRKIAVLNGPLMLDAYSAHRVAEEALKP